jgi:diacylglycerol kinase family enzyme
VCVIFNPRACSGRAARCLERLRRALGSRAEFWLTRARGHGAELALEAAEAGFAVVAAAGGDGTVHEVANGLLQSPRNDVTLAVLPVGSANDYADSLGLTCDWWAQPNGGIQPRAVDVGVVTAPGGRKNYFVNNLGIGLTGAVALEAERVPLRGLGRYLVGLIRTLCYRYDQPMMSVTLDDRTRQEPTLALSLGIGRREGSFLLVPHAEIDDGLFDYVHAGALSRLALLRLLPAGIRGCLPTDHPRLHLGRCQRARVESEAPLIAHGDGEFICRPEENIRGLEVAILPGRLRVLRQASKA